MEERQKKLKENVAKAAVKYIAPNMVIGIGTGSTIDFLIKELVTVKDKIKAIVSSSEESTKRLKSLGINNVCTLSDCKHLDIYIDSTDKANINKELIKGGGAALTREKICCVSSKKFICIIDESKVVKTLGKFPLAIEVIPMATSHVSKEIIKLGGSPVYRKGLITDNGNVIIDVHNLTILDPQDLETKINQIVGVVCNGIFSHNPADILLIAKNSGKIEEI